jgi:hypothetical protein
MTQICFKNGVLAADSRETDEDGTVVNERSKKIYTKGRWLIAAAGDSQDCAWFYSWMENGFTKASPTEYDTDSEALLVDKKTRKIFRAYMNGEREELDPHQAYAIGCQNAMALALMTDARMTPKQAITVIAKYEGGVNARVQNHKCW